MSEEINASELIKFPVRYEFDETDGYASSRIYDSHGSIFLDIRNSERWRDNAELIKSELIGNFIAEAINNHSRLKELEEEVERMKRGEYICSKCHLRQDAKNEDEVKF